MTTTASKWVQVQVQCISSLSLSSTGKSQDLTRRRELEHPSQLASEPELEDWNSKLKFPNWARPYNGQSGPAGRVMDFFLISTDREYFLEQKQPEGILHKYFQVQFFS